MTILPTASQNSHRGEASRFSSRYPSPVSHPLRYASSMRSQRRPPPAPLLPSCAAPVPPQPPSCAAPPLPAPPESLLQKGPGGGGGRLELREEGDGAAVRGLLRHRAPAPLPALRAALPSVLLVSPTLCCPRPARRLGEGRRQGGDGAPGKMNGGEEKQRRKKKPGKKKLV
ncbi:hypothetical protein PVAP13_5NG151862 [Panicum virgatum]|uniref:Uncharacterized protein n=1 Tax=Panicum virgatum TaxID=38727 RepID=A0A8T0RPU3_PANVG|nr:hypothetical protein PVAP13_5NG151862 [Panicum virgatum]